jgi:serine/threonine protein kinase/tetratricopeptide (TPR) repeat protein
MLSSRFGFQNGPNLLTAWSDPTMTLTASTRLGPYEILSKLGSGGMGEVYRARDTRLDREVAIKVLPAPLAQDPQALARFQREAKAVAALSHPHILTLYDIGTEQGTTYAVMELLEGQTLGGLLRQGPLDWRRVLTLATAIAEGLSAAHAKGITHRDIKPDNIFLTLDGGLKILDFGLARLEKRTVIPAGGAGATVSLETQPGVVMGTVNYMSPEQVRGLPADARSDVFSFGSMLHEMLTGRRPFDGDTSADTMAAILHNPPPPLSQSGRERPAELDRVVLRCLEKDAGRRYPSARELAAALKSLSQEAVTSDSGSLKRIETAATLCEEASGGRGGKSSGPSVAVLPFVNMSSDPENEFFSDGLAEELIAVLTKVKGLHVASRTSAFAFKGKNEDVRKIGEQLNVRTVLEGSVRKSGNRLRISAQLVNVADGYHLWSETYNRQLQDVFEIQDEIAQNIAGALQVILTEKDKQAVENAQPADVQAYEFYLRGRQFFHQFRGKAFDFAQQMFTRAIEIDPTYARAYAGIADCHSLLYLLWEASEANLNKADEASRKALKLGPNLAEAHVARGVALSLRKEYAEARQEFETAIRLDPSLFEARYFFGRTYMREGKLLEAAEQFEKACQMRQDDYQSASHLASIYNGLGRKTEAQTASRRCLRVIEKHLALHPDDPRALYLGAISWTKLGEPARALEWAGRAVAMDPDEPLTLYNVACVYALQGQTEQALDCLERGCKHFQAHKEWMKHDADLNSLRDHPRFQALVS